MHGRMHPNLGLATILLAHDPLSSLAYPMSHPHPQQIILFDKDIEVIAMILILYDIIIATILM